MANVVQISDPPSRDSRFVVGRDMQGRWVVCDQKGLVGGLFANRDSAIHFAEFESDHVPGAVCCASDDAVVTLAGLSDIRSAAPALRSFGRP